MRVVPSLSRAGQRLWTRFRPGRLARGSGPRQVEFLRPKHAGPQDLDSLTSLEGIVSGTSLLAQVVLD